MKRKGYSLKNVKRYTGFYFLTGLIIFVVLSGIYYFQNQTIPFLSNFQIKQTSDIDSEFLKQSSLFNSYTLPFNFSEAKTANVVIFKANYGPPSDNDLYELKTVDNKHLFAKSRLINLNKYVGKKVNVTYKEVKGVIMGEQQLVLIDSLEEISELDLTKDWKTYISPQYNYSVKYPKDWSIVNKQETNFDATTFSSPSDDILKYKPALISIYVVETKQLNLNQWLKDHSPYDVYEVKQQDDRSFIFIAGTYIEGSPSSEETVQQGKETLAKMFSSFKTK